MRPIVKVLWIVVMVAAVIAAFVFVVGLGAAEDSVGIAAFSAMAVAIAAIPYIFARAVSEFGNNSSREDER